MKSRNKSRKTNLHDRLNRLINPLHYGLFIAQNSTTGRLRARVNIYYSDDKVQTIESNLNQEDKGRIECERRGGIWCTGTSKMHD